MSRSGYSDECENVWLYRQAVARAVKGRRGQSFLREMVAALDAMETRELAAFVLVDTDGSCCALGSVALARGLDTDAISDGDSEMVAQSLDIAYSLAAEVAYENDEHPRPETDAGRWVRMREWAVSNLEAAPQVTT